MHKISDIIINTQNQLSKIVADQSAIAKIKNSLHAIEIFKQNSAHYRVAKFSQGILYLSVSSAAFATQIRHHSSAILQTLQKKLANIQFNAIQCKVSTFTSTAQTAVAHQHNKTKPLNTSTKKKILTLSEKIHSESLKRALEALIK